MWEWLYAPLDATRPHDVGGLLSWHARLMVFAWAILVPIGIIVARFFKVWPGQKWPSELDDQHWWWLHRVCQYGAAIFSVIALLLILNAGALTIIDGPHGQLGWIVLALLLVQVAGGILRGSKGGPTDSQLSGDHYDMTVRRLWFEWVHKVSGYLALILAVVAISTGLWQANAPNWMALILVLWWGFLVVLVVYLQAKGRALDTYQAIWGTDPDLPGNRRKPIGLGMVQHQDDPED